jgi:hypothetical protein
MAPPDAALDRATGAGRRRAWAWTAALRDGATTPWREWSHEGEPLAARLPGAQQLELLRRVNVAAQQQGRQVPTAVADRILAAGVSGRGRGELALEGADDDRRFGPPPVDPGALPEDELLRVAAGLVADDVARATPEPTLVDRAKARMPWRRSFVVVGSQWLADAANAGLVASGHRPGGRRPTAYVLADDLATLLAHAWTARAFDQGGPRWTEFLEAFAQAGHLPPRADLARMARSAAERYDAASVTIVLDRAALVRELVDLVRRVGEPLGLLVPHEQRPALLRATLAPRLDGLGGPPPTVPVRWATWLRTQAERLHHDLAAADYPVLGDLDRILPGALPDTPVLPDDAEVLDLAVGLILDPVRPTGPATATDPATPAANQEAP